MHSWERLVGSREIDHTLTDCIYVRNCVVMSCELLVCPTFSINDFVDILSIIVVGGDDGDGGGGSGGAISGNGSGSCSSRGSDSSSRSISSVEFATLSFHSVRAAINDCILKFSV